MVLFSVLLGVALIGVERKQCSSTFWRRQRRHYREPQVLRRPDAVRHLRDRREHRRNVEPRQLGASSLLVTYMVMALLVALWVLPGLVAALTPFRYREVLGPTRDALITAFMAGDLFIVLPIVIQACKSCCRCTGHR